MPLAFVMPTGAWFDVMTAPHAERGDRFAAEGEIVEILEEAEARRAKVVLKPGTVIDVTAAKEADVHLGDRVIVEGTTEAIRTKNESTTPVVPSSGPGRLVREPQSRRASCAGHR